MQFFAVEVAREIENVRLDDFFSFDFECRPHPDIHHPVELLPFPLDSDKIDAEGGNQFLLERRLEIRGWKSQRSAPPIAMDNDALETVRIAERIIRGDDITASEQFPN